MARYTGPVCRLCRREGTKLFLKGKRCYGEKCSITKRAFAPGQHGQGKRTKATEYGIQLREKQKARRIYGVLETQFRRYFHRATSMHGVTGENLLSLLERRLDNVVYRLGFALSRAEARQMVRHGHFQVNGKKVSIPSYVLRADDVVIMREEARAGTRVQEIGNWKTAIPEWLEREEGAFQGKVNRIPRREDVDLPLEEHLIVELYSR